MKTQKETTDREAFFKAYVGCALWAETDNSTDSGGKPLDQNYSVKDIADETLAEMRKDCDGFIDDNEALLDVSGLSPERAGFCFWLNRNGHGSGFWDEGQEPCFRALSQKSKEWGRFDLYLGDDGKIYGG